MTEALITLGVIVLVSLFVWLARRWGIEAGEARAEARTSKASNEIQRDITDAIGKAPASRDDIERRARDGGL